MKFTSIERDPDDRVLEILGKEEDLSSRINELLQLAELERDAEDGDQHLALRALAAAGMLMDLVYKGDPGTLEVIWQETLQNIDGGTAALAQSFREDPSEIQNTGDIRAVTNRYSINIQPLILTHTAIEQLSKNDYQNATNTLTYAIGIARFAMRKEDLELIKPLWDPMINLIPREVWLAATAKLEWENKLKKHSPSDLASLSFWKNPTESE